jgi:hypothetical protein
MIKRMILILQFDEFLLIPPEQVYLLLEMADDDVLLVALHLEWRVEIG